MKTSERLKKAGWEKAWKVVNPRFLSAYAGGLPNSAMIKYGYGKISSPANGNGPMCCFAYKKYAINFYGSLGIIVKVLIKRSRMLNAWFRGWSGRVECLVNAPEGTIFADKLYVLPRSEQ